MADRFQHEDGLKAQDIELAGKRLVKARKGRAGHEASKLAEKGAIDRDKAGIVEKRAKKLEETAGKLASAPEDRQKGVSGYMKKKGSARKALEEAGDY